MGELVSWWLKHIHTHTRTHTHTCLKVFSISAFFCWAASTFLFIACARVRTSFSFLAL